VQKRSAKKNGPVITRPFGREVSIVTANHPQISSTH
jgi:hypothetical protein